jgi:hypothetical protein
LRPLLMIVARAAARGNPAGNGPPLQHPPPSWPRFDRGAAFRALAHRELLTDGDRQIALPSSRGSMRGCPRRRSRSLPATL